MKVNYGLGLQVTNSFCYLQYTNIIDRRNNAILPTTGGYLKSSVEVAGLGGDVSFFRAESNYLYTKTLLKYLVS